jgi:hypothetical protein
VSDQLSVFAVRHRPPTIGNTEPIKAYFSRLLVAVYSRLSQAALFLGTEFRDRIGEDMASNLTARKVGKPIYCQKEGVT